MLKIFTSLASVPAHRVEYCLRKIQHWEVQLNKRENPILMLKKTAQKSKSDPDLEVE